MRNIVDDLKLKLPSLRMHKLDLIVIIQNVRDLDDSKNVRF